jgi:hypothetical protein
MQTLPAVKAWLREHPGETFTTVEIAAEYGLRSPEVSRVLRQVRDDGTYPDLTRRNRTTWTLSKDAAYRITRDAPLANGARLEVIGHDHGGVILARDPAGRLWVVTPLELPA